MGFDRYSRCFQNQGSSYLQKSKVEKVRAQQQGERMILIMMMYEDIIIGLLYKTNCMLKDDIFNINGQIKTVDKFFQLWV